MTTRDRRKVESALTRKGFKKDDSHHHRFFHYTANGQATGVRTHTSHSPRHKTLGDDLLNEMARQCRISKADFLKLVDCGLTGEEYGRRVTTSREQSVR